MRYHSAVMSHHMYGVPSTVNRTVGIRSICHTPCSSQDPAPGRLGPPTTSSTRQINRQKAPSHHLHFEICCENPHETENGVTTSSFLLLWELRSPSLSSNRVSSASPRNRRSPQTTPTGPEYVLIHIDCMSWRLGG